MKCEFYNNDGTTCGFDTDDKTEMIHHITDNHGTQEANEYLDA